MTEPEKENVRRAVRETYGDIAKRASRSCGCSADPCCAGETPGMPYDSTMLGYTEEELENVPEGSNMVLGCGNPQLFASIKPGETVLDLGSGGGLDCFLASKRVGEKGRVIGVDMTPEMLFKARENAVMGGYGNVEFRLGEIENLPVADESIDVIISNCVINLSTDKPRVFREAYRVLKPGGRLAVSDVVATAAMSDEIRSDLKMYSGCVAGAVSVDELVKMLEQAGFDVNRIDPKEKSSEFIKDWAPGTNIGELILSASIEAVKPD